MTDQDFERRLRATLTAHAQDAPRSEVVERRVLDAALVAPAGRRIPWRTITAPVLAAGAVAALVIALVGVEHDRPSASHPVAPATQGSDPSPTSPSPSPSPSATTTPVVRPGATLTVPGRTHVRIKDMSVVGNDVWALAWADCTGGVNSSCATLLHSADDGATWRAVAAPVVTVEQTACTTTPCLDSIRFATPDVGYVFGRSTMFMTTDGGRTWVQELGAAALETLDGNVIRVVPAPSSCIPPGCTYTAQTAAIGSTSWHDTGLQATANGMSTGVSLVRVSSEAVLVVYGHPAGGAGNARSNVYLSSDDGATWQNRGEPCAQGPVETDTTAVTAAADGALLVLCTRREAPGGQFVATSNDAGATFHAAAIVDESARSLLAAPTRAHAFLGSPGLSRSTDGGATWTPILRNDSLTWLGFESMTTGAAVSGDGTTIYRTSDGGATWIAHTFV